MGCFCGSTEKGSSINLNLKFSLDSDSLLPNSWIKNSVSFVYFSPSSMYLHNRICFIHVGKLYISPFDSWFLNSFSFILKAFTAARIWKISVLFPWSCKFNSFRWLVMSHKKYRSLFQFSWCSSGKLFVSFSKNWTISSLRTTKRCKTLPRLNQRTSVR